MLSLLLSLGSLMAIEGKLIYKKFGKMSAKEIKQALTLIEENL